MNAKEAFDKDERQQAILVFFDHQTNKIWIRAFAGQDACIRATQYRDDLKAEHLNCSTSLIQNDAAALAWQNHIMKEFDTEAEVDGNIPDPEPE